MRMRNEGIVFPGCLEYPSSRRTTGSYSFGYDEMNSLLREAHLRRRQNKAEADADFANRERIAIVCVAILRLVLDHRNTNISRRTQRFAIELRFMRLYLQEFTSVNHSSLIFCPVAY